MTYQVNYKYQVTPYVGVWIEIIGGTVKVSVMRVTPYVGVWIEIC